MDERGVQDQGPGVMDPGQPVPAPLVVKAGDVITFPTGKDGAHVIRNGSDTEKLIYIDFDTVHVPEIVHLPDANKVMVIGPYSNGTYDEK